MTYQHPPEIARLLFLCERMAAQLTGKIDDVIDALRAVRSRQWTALVPDAEREELALQAAERALATTSHEARWLQRIARALLAGEQRAAEAERGVGMKVANELRAERDALRAKLDAVREAVR